MQNQNTGVEGRYRTLMILWFALLLSQALLFFVTVVAKPEALRFDFSKPPLGDNPLMPLMFAVLSVSNLALSFVLRKKYLNQSVSDQNPGLVQTAVIVGCALCESISLFGIVQAFAFSYQYFFLWFALGITGTLLHFPKRDDLIAASYKR